MSTLAPEQDEQAMLTPEELQYAPLLSKIKAWNLDCQVNAEFPINKIERSAAAQVRDPSHIAPSQRVEEYTQQMRNGAIFPPMLKIGCVVGNGSRGWFGKSPFARSRNDAS